MRALPFALAILVMSVGASPGGAAEKSPHAEAMTRAETELAAIQQGISGLERTYRTATAETYQHTLERRLVDARLLYQLKHYDKAVVLFAELVDDPGFKGNRDYWPVTYDLALSLYRNGNYRASVTYFSRIVDGNVAQYHQAALGYLLDIAMTTGDYELLNQYYRILDGIPAARRLTSLTYAYGKVLYFQDAFDDALAEFGRIPAGDAYFARAAYYSGVAFARQGNFDQAHAAFARAAESAGKGGEDGEEEEFGDLADLGWLAIGRLLEESGKLVESVDAYQRIERNSPYYEMALFEMTWAFIKSSRFDKALNTLDVLILVVEDDALAIQANVLRGRLNIFLKRFDDAEDDYERVVERFSPLKIELLSFMQDRRNVRHFFKWLMAGETRKAAMKRPVSKRAMGWMRADETMTDLLSVFNDIRAQKDDIAEFKEIVRMMEARLTSGSSLEIFPNLAEAWYAVAAHENRLIRLASEVLNTEGALYASVLASDDAASVAVVRDARAALEKAFGSIPFSIVDYSSRKTGVSKTYDNFDAELFVLEGTVSKAITDIDSLDMWIRKNLANDAGSTREMTSAEKELLREVRSEHDRWASVLGQIKGAREAIAVARVTQGVGDVVMKSETNLKNRLIGMQTREAALFQARREGLGATKAALENRAISIRRGINASFGRLGALVAVLNTKTQQKLADTRRQVQVERERLEQYERRLAETEASTMKISEDVGSILFQVARDEIDSVVLEADLGLIDIAWQKKRQLATEIREYNAARNTQIQQIDENLEGFLGK